MGGRRARLLPASLRILRNILTLRSIELLHIKIFDLQQAVRDTHGKAANFYSLLGVERDASAPTLKKAYRKKSLEVHPDRNSSPIAAKHFEQLGLINKILRDHRRDRYDHFLANGFPQWRGTGYFYARFRPGLGLVLLLILGLTVLVQRGIQQYNYVQNTTKLRNARRSAKLLALGPTNETPLEFQAAASVGSNTNKSNNKGDRKVRIPLGGFDNLPPLPSTDAEASAETWAEHERALKRVASAPSSSYTARTIDVVVSADGEWVAGVLNHEEHEIDPELELQPSWSTTWPAALLRTIVPTKQEPLLPASDAEEQASNAAPAAAASAPAMPQAANSTSTKPKKAAAINRKKKGGK